MMKLFSAGSHQRMNYGNFSARSDLTVDQGGEPAQHRMQRKTNA
jgi:hypothetical protein